MKAGQMIAVVERITGLPLTRETSMVLAADMFSQRLAEAMSQQLSPETPGETRAAAAVWQATVRNGADVVLTDEGPLLQVLCLAVVIGQFWPALRVCVRRQQHRAPRPGCAV